MKLLSPFPAWRHLHFPLGLLIASALSPLLGSQAAAKPLLTTPRPIAKTGVKKSTNATVGGSAVAAFVANDTNIFTVGRDYVDPNNSSKAAANSIRSSRPADAAKLDRLAQEGVPLWTGDWTPDPYGPANAHVTAATAAAQIPTIVAYNIPYRDNGSYSAGGATSAAAYRTWIDRLALGIGSRKAAVVLEPDALGHLSLLPSAQQTERLALLSYAIEKLAANPQTAVYVDASMWVAAADMASRLNSIGISRARGFCVNTSAFNPTAECITYGRDVAGRTGKKFIVDTSRNGNGPWTPSAGDTEAWCNPPGRALGPRFTTATADPACDAYLFVKTVGESDGACHGGPAAGTYWIDYALGLINNTPGFLSTTPGTTPGTTPTPATTDVISGGTYKLTHKSTNQCLDVAGNRSTSGTNVIQWTDNGSDAQRWIVALQSDGTYKLTHKGTNKCLNVAGNSSAPAANVNQSTDNGTSAQRWKIEKQADGTYKLLHKGTNQYLDVANASTASGANMQQYTANDSHAQRWQLTLISAPTSAGQALATTSVPQFAESALRVYPNPAQDVVTVEYEAAAAQPAVLTLTDGMGRVVQEQAVQLHAGSNRVQFQPGPAAVGLYQLTLTAGEKRYQTKVQLLAR